MLPAIRLIVLGLALVALGILTIWGTGPFVIVMLIPGAIVLWRGLGRLMPPEVAYFVALLIAIALFFGSARILSN